MFFISVAFATAVTLALICATTSPLRAQSAVGFRSGFTEGTGIPPKGAVEVDYGSSMTTSGSTRAYAAGEFTAHVPIATRLGVRLHLNSYTWITSPGGTVAGRENPGIGTASSFRDAKAWKPMIALLTRMDTPSGTLPNRVREWQPTAKMVLAWQLPARFSLASNLGLARLSDQGNRFTQHFASLWVARRLSRHLGSFTEVVVHDREKLVGPSSTVLRGGITLQATAAHHFDVHVSTQLSGNQPRRSIGIGLKERF